ncbi:MAG: DUF1566 domain-containing protein, partial [Proteobacteria bacterium]|nr:DUF1566 domain-containing protein [Pseudomonadota bacterium]
EERRKLEAEYARLVAERKRLEENRGRPDEEGLDIIYDPQTGLEWRLAPDAPASHQEAENWVKSLAPGGGWRMPTQEELKSLYQENAGERNMKPPFKTTGLGVWAAGASGTCFDFKWGKPIQRWNSQGYPVTFMDMRAFAVRKRRSE